MNFNDAWVKDPKIFAINRLPATLIISGQQIWPVWLLKKIHSL